MTEKDEAEFDEKFGGKEQHFGVGKAGYEDGTPLPLGKKNWRHKCNYYCVVPDKLTLDNVKAFITRKQQELVDSILAEIPDGQLNVAQSTGQPFKTVLMEELKQSIKEKYLNE